MEKLSLIKKNDWHHDCRNTNCFVTYTEQMFSDEQKKCSDKMSIGLDKVKVVVIHTNLRARFNISIVQ